MSAVFFVNSGASSTNAGGSSNIGLGTGDSYGGTATSDTICRAAGIFSKLYSHILSNTLSGSTTITFRVNGADATQTFSIASGLTGAFYDNINTDSVSASNTFCARIVCAAGTGSITRGALGISFAATTNSATLLATNGVSRSFEGAGANVYAGPSALTSFNVTESNAQIRIPTAGTLKNLYVYCSSNSDPSAETITSRINGSSGTLTVSITASTTGAFEDTTHSDSIAANDLVSWEITRTGSVAGGFWFVGPITINLETTGGSFLSGGGTVGGQTSTDGTTKYLINFEYRDTETDQQYRLFASYDFSKLRIRVTGNATSSASTFDLRLNEASSALTVSVTAGTTGNFVDDTHTVSGVAGDRINLRIVNGGGGSLIWVSQSMLIAQAAAIVADAISPGAAVGFA